MDIFSIEFLTALGAIILIDLVLAGDNALVIAMAARRLPPADQKKAIIWGTVGAIVVRSVMTLGIVWLLKIPGLLIIGGLLLVWISLKLLASSDSGHDSESNHGSTTLMGAMKTIVIADAVMGIDNVLGVAGAAQGSFLLVILGLLISIPIVVWCSGLVLKLVDRYPQIIYLGSAVLAWTAAGMMLNEPLVKDWIEPFKNWSWVFTVVVVLGVILTGYLTNRKGQSKTAQKLVTN
jgi:YjbE family integral membrane protein